MALQVLSTLESPWDADVALKSMTKHGREERKQNSTQNVLQKEKQSPNIALQLRSSVLGRNIWNLLERKIGVRTFRRAGGFQYLKLLRCLEMGGPQ